MSNRELIDDGAALIQQGNEQEKRDRAAGAKALFCAGNDNFRAGKGARETRCGEDH